jgi:nitroreductase
MDALECIMTRRSIRSYTDEAVGDADIETILKAAMSAPSAGNEQPWHFVVIRDRETMNQIMDVHPYSGMLDHAPVCIAVCAELAREKYDGYWVQDTSAATLNLLLAAHAIGLGGVWLGVHPVESRGSGIKRILGLPDGVECLGLVALGHPAAEAGPADRYDASRIHEGQW